MINLKAFLFNYYINFGFVKYKNLNLSIWQTNFLNFLLIKSY